MGQSNNAEPDWTYYLFDSLDGSEIYAIYRYNKRSAYAEVYTRKRKRWVLDIWMPLQLLMGNIGPSEIVSEAEAMKIIAAF